MEIDSGTEAIRRVEEDALIDEVQLAAHNVGVSVGDLVDLLERVGDVDEADLMDLSDHLAGLDATELRALWLALAFARKNRQLARRSRISLETEFALHHSAPRA